ncbi:TRAP transporter substrate-binding protein DctP [Paracoccus sp. 1_MG-2023]|uniref:TRAP transporter substrate-binding protein n=1 Tax=unclassified Paracoccus (in: a-proteobacteria) TaxID=2688777 RepID=UPI001C0867D9|nr:MULTISPECIES: TRAP transporter substrate-binding protein DctP [unclassified Paracoccus (in: a-proteobacteria)]MBU2958288.1 TRAP transporter substrate-binding protein DctP [Paracoccus sp. C2R09]MDO6668415.1 TRAP transporter substrate-binding protein DctP [Paracoccus sp. 1_MG-2023]
MTTRRQFLSAGAVLGGLSVAGLPRRAFASETLTGVSYLPPSYADLAYGSQGLVDRVNEAGEGVVALDYHDSGRLVSADEQLPALRAGTIDFMFHTSSYVTRSLPILGVLGLPGVVGPLYENPDRLRRGSPLFDLIAAELEKQGLRCLSLGGGIMEPEYVWSVESAPITDLTQIQGKKIRLVSFEASAALEHFGAAPVRIPSSELYIALERGTVDAAVANISTINGRAIQEQVRYAYRMPVTGFAIGIFTTTRRWDAMPEDVRAAFMEGVEWFDQESARAANEDYFRDQYWPAFREAGIEVIEPSEAEIAEFDKINADVRQVWLDEVGAEVGERAIALAMGEGA